MITLRKISGHIVDVWKAQIYKGTIEIEGGKIVRIIEDEAVEESGYILPGLIDAHIHIESSLLTPSAFARLAVRHGTVATVSDPHEIANILGIVGVDYMIEDGRRTPLKFYFGAPSCVPATPFETAGAVLDAECIEALLCRKEIRFLGEMMNYPGVISRIPEVMARIDVAKRYGKPIDGHAPALTGENLAQYIGAGISTDHESMTEAEAREKIESGMKILIREGSAAKNFEVLNRLIDQYPASCMFCSDDRHPDDLLCGHINLLVKRALDCGRDLMNVLRCACVNPVLHYGLDVGLLRVGDDADFIIVDSLDHFNVLKTVIRGEVVMEGGLSTFTDEPTRVLNVMATGLKKPEDFIVVNEGEKIRVIEACNGQLVTGQSVESIQLGGAYVMTDPGRDMLKIAVVNRYADVKPAVAFIRNFGMKRGAVASSVAHDSHNIVAVGVSDEDLALAVNAVICNGGGLSAVSGEEKHILPLPVAGIMSAENGEKVARDYERMNRTVREFGCPLDAPFMTLSFMSLPVIPHLKLTDRGLFDGDTFRHVSLFV
ncbi:MAG: adenine deaminase [Syntrophaceae bacterium]|nr:adenine deaminase [Syntrophaceae bacterium]